MISLFTICTHFVVRSSSSGLISPQQDVRHILQWDPSLLKKYCWHSNWITKEQGLQRLRQCKQDMINQTNTSLHHVPQHIQYIFPRTRRPLSTSATIIKWLKRPTGASLQTTLRHGQDRCITKVASVLADMARLQKKQILAAHSVCVATRASIPLNQLMQCMAKLLHAMRTDHTMLASIKTNLLKDHKDIFAATALPPGVSPGVTYPSPAKL